MKTVAILAELNPLHNGHAALIEHAKNVRGADAIIVLLSGDFVQRGEPAVISKMRRCRAALSAGADLVLELPLIYCLAPAEIYARGAVLTLDALGIVDEMLFGSETGDLQALSRTAEMIDLLSEDPEFHDRILAAMRDGDPYPAAFSKAVGASGHQTDVEDPSALIPADRPNDLLGMEYVRSIRKLNSAIMPVCMRRMPQGNEISSATKLRELIKNDVSTIRPFVPDASWREVSEIAVSDSERFAEPDDLSQILMYRLLASDPKQLSEIADIGQDLGQRIYHSRLSCEHFGSYAAALKVKAFTLSRIRRSLLQLIFGITQKERSGMLSEKATLLRVLGFRENARNLLSRIAENSSARMIVRGADFHADLSGSEKRLAELALFSGALYDSLTLSASLRKPEEEKMPVIA